MNTAKNMLGCFGSEINQNANIWGSLVLLKQKISWGPPVMYHVGNGCPLKTCFLFVYAQGNPSHTMDSAKFLYMKIQSCFPWYIVTSGDASHVFWPFFPEINAPHFFWESTRHTGDGNSIGEQWSKNSPASWSIWISSLARHNKAWSLLGVPSPKHVNRIPLVFF